VRWSLKWKLQKRGDTTLSKASVSLLREGRDSRGRRKKPKLLLRDQKMASPMAVSQRSYEEKNIGGGMKNQGANRIGNWRMRGHLTSKEEGPTSQRSGSFMLHDKNRTGKKQAKLNKLPSWMKTSERREK